jgi:oligopeptide/dipeptide ABC transporter ATP-binding protein
MELEHITKHFPLRRGVADIVSRAPTSAVQAVTDVTLSIDPGETLAIVGESGSGKTTLGRVAAGLHAPSSGMIRFQGENVTRPSAAVRRKLKRDVQVVFQDPFTSLNPRHRVEDIVREPLDIHRIGTPAERRARVQELLNRVRVPTRLAAALPHELSGGLRQRVGSAAARALGPKLIVADEPLSALDVSVQAEVLDLLAELQRDQGLAYILISHDLGVVEEVSDRVAVMYLGRIVELGGAAQIFASPTHPYTRALLSSTLVADPTVPHAPIRLAGEIPTPIHPPSGCAFRTRCWQAEQGCAEAVPPLTPVTAGHDMACHVESRRLSPPTTAASSAVRS